jgi:phosphopantothenoylcysteine decarboxylase/phosphopantothenate--cysteine ligase
LAEVASWEQRPFLVGFAAEAGSIERGIAKASTKGVDLLVVNDISSPGSEFGSDTNEVTLAWPSGATEPLDLQSKTAVATVLLDRVRDSRT